MKKVCIITMYGDWNYGNKLQNYALQETLKKMNCDVTSLKNKYQTTIYNKLKNKYYQLRQIKKYQLLSKRKKIFKRFNDNYMSYTKYSVTNNLSKKKSDKFDYFVIGSDQVWNYGEGSISDIMFGLFTTPNRNISYAASFGVSEIPKKYEKIYIRGLNNIKYLSVREEAGKKIIKKIVNKDSEVVLDPTLLLDKNEWLKIEIKPSFIKNQKYLLTYFLGNVNQNKKNEMKDLAKKYNLKIINLNDIKEEEVFKVGPEEFLYLFRHADIIFTDSFHACVFSVIYEKPFFVYERDENVASMNSRIENFLDIIQQKERLIKSIKDYDEDLLFLQDYTKSIELLNEKRKKSIEFLDNALNDE